MPGIFSKIKSRFFFDRYSLVQFYRQLSTLVKAGFGSLRGIQTCIRQTSEPRLKEVLNRISVNMEAGAEMSEAISKTTGVFSTFHVSMIRAAEVSGNLPEVLESLSDYEEKEMTLARRIQTATTYPAFIFLVSFATIIILMKFLLPLLKTVTDVLKEDLPLPTKILMRFSSAVSHPAFYVFLVLLAILFYILYNSYITTRAGRFSVDRIKLKAPLYGKLYKKIVLIRVCRVMQTLLHSGVPAAMTLKLLGEVSDNYYFKDRIIDGISYKVDEGTSLATAFESSGFFPSLMVSMINIGEQSGSLPMALGKLSDIFEFDVDMAMATFYATLEPALIVIMGGITFFILSAAFLPIYKIVGTISR